MHTLTQAPWWRQKKWWIDHWADVIGAIVIPLMLYMIDCNGKKADELLVRKQIDIQQQSKSESAAEADNHQAISLLSDMATRIGSDQLPQRRAIAQAVLEYSAQGRLYHPSTAVVIDYLGHECDSITHDLLHQAVEVALNQTPKNATIPTCGEKSVDGETLAGCAKRKTDAQAAVKSDQDTDRGSLSKGEQQRMAVCQPSRGPASVGTNPGPNQGLGGGLRVFRQYTDVGCGATNQATLQVQLTDEERKTLKIAMNPTAHFEGVSNLNWKNIDKIQLVGDDLIQVAYSIRGLDRQFLGNCPGGGHATVVVDYQVVPRDATTAQPQSQAQQQ